MKKQGEILCFLFFYIFPRTTIQYCRFHRYSISCSIKIIFFCWPVLGLPHSTKRFFYSILIFINYRNAVSNEDNEFLYLFKEYDFTPVEALNFILGKIGVREIQYDNEQIEVKASHDEDGIEGFEEIDDLFNFDPS